MYASRCFEKSEGKGKMGCISCHDPHSVPSEKKKVDFYRQRCLNCHQDRGCSVPEADRFVKENSCIACHMPKSDSNINHAAISDHRILRQPDPRPRPASVWPIPGQMPLVHFHHHLIDGKDVQVERDRAIALVKVANDHPSWEVGRSLTALALPELESALSRDDSDVETWEAKGSALWFQGRLEESALAFEKVLQMASEREQSLIQMVTLNLRLRRIDSARDSAERLLKVSPWRWRHHLLLAQVHGQDQSWDAALKAAAKALELNPSEPSVRQFLVLCHLRRGERTRAQQEFDTLVAINPSRSDSLRRWFAEVSGSAGGKSR
jgi:tetratricopeptide (TPR) repeat protein